MTFAFISYVSFDQFKKNVMIIELLLSLMEVWLADSCLWPD